MREDVNELMHLDETVECQRQQSRGKVIDGRIPSDRVDSDEIGEDRWHHTEEEEDTNEERGNKRRQGRNVLIMPVGIVQVMNNTSRTLHYHNLESGHNININPKTQQYENDGWIPSSNFHDDRVPFRSSNHIKVWLDNGPAVEISDDNWKFCIVGPVNYSSETAVYRCGSLDHGGKYILRLDGVDDGKTKNCGLTFLKYEDKYQVTAGHIASQLIQHAAPLVALVLMAIFL
ncbi:hypothetical protein HYDPIDRAFT_170696 [Hydnomerulius pinastri MD-312]|uniref:Uncharacterized protein n=1 Tax=Hydnomerulius pinastri MD-312 TaxID=994086 RepID=A0A0C9W9N7_9AGAM|nr:hypothetical protein HYDPIDRAFT_170696 [Hydnomerulius pinastri MD-312]